MLSVIMVTWQQKACFLRSLSRNKANAYPKALLLIYSINRPYFFIFISSQPEFFPDPDNVFAPEDVREQFHLFLAGTHENVQDAFFLSSSYQDFFFSALFS